jgi:hypothetical protein
MGQSEHAHRGLQGADLAAPEDDDLGKLDPSEITEDDVIEILAGI